MKPFTQFKPSENQLAVLSAMQAEDYGCTVDAACERVGLCREVYYRWFDRNSGFGEWWRQEAEAHFGRKLPRVYAAALRSAGGQDVKGAFDRKLLLERFDAGYAPKSRQEHTGKLTWADAIRELDAEQTPDLDSFARGPDSLPYTVQTPNDPVLNVDVCPPIEETGSMAPHDGANLMGEPDPQE